MSQFNEQCQSFVLGSDQIWNNDLYHAFAEFADLKWVNNDHLKIAYATSFGADFIWGTETDRQQMTMFLNRFDAISVRENSGVDILRDSYGVSATHVLDPVFLCDKKKYIALAKKGGYYELQNEKYIFSYMLDLTEEKIICLEQAKEFRKQTLITVTDAARDEQIEQKKWSFPLKTGLWLEEWLAHIICSDFVITDSFHGMCVAIIFHKPFLVIINHARGATRFYSLLDQLKLHGYIVELNDSFIDKLEFLQTHPVNWDQVDSILEKEKRHSIEWLKNALELSVKDTFKTSYDLLAPSVMGHDEHTGYIDNFTYLDVLPSQACSGKRTRLALGDQCLLFQVFDSSGTIEQNLSIASQQELEPIKENIANILEKQMQIIQQLDSMEKDKINCQNVCLNLQSHVQSLSSELETVTSSVQVMQHSYSYKIGRAITWLPRKIINFLSNKYFRN